MSIRSEGVLKHEERKAHESVRKSRVLLIKYIHPVEYQSVGKMGVMQPDQPKAEAHKTFSLSILYWQALCRGEGICLQKLTKRRRGYEIFYKNEG